MRLGYACLNFHVKEAGTSKHNLPKKSFKSDRSLKRTSGVVLKNLQYIHQVLRWNAFHNVPIFRFSHFAPFMTEYEFTDLPDYDQICGIAAGLGEMILYKDFRLTNHPGQFAVLASPKPEVNQNTANELNKIAQIFDMFGLPRSPQCKINIHIGGTYGNKPKTLERFIENLSLLSVSALSRLTIENDDEPNGYTVRDLVEGVSAHVPIPVVFDTLHHRLNPGKESFDEAFYLARSTWTPDVRQLIHHSESKTREDPTADKKAHSEYIEEELRLPEEEVDVIFECKACEKAVLRYRERWEK